VLDWLPRDGPVRWIAGALAFGLLWLAGEAVARAVFAIRTYGVRAYLRSVFRFDLENFRIIGVLALLAAAMAMVYLW
jgi:hypothetical protein